MGSRLAAVKARGKPTVAASQAATITAAAQNKKDMVDSIQTVGGNSVAWHIVSKGNETC
ncbi:hypothetical protein GCM10018965_080710 [Nonomuraea roseola]